MKTTPKLAIAGALAWTIAGTVVGVQVTNANAAENQTAAQRSNQAAPGLVMPAMDPVRGKQLFASKGCVVCHSINGVGGTDAAKLDASVNGGAKTGQRGGAKAGQRREGAPTYKWARSGPFVCRRRKLFGS